MISALAFGGLVSCLLTAPYLIPKAGVSPMHGIVLWLSVLSMRAVLSVATVFACVLYLPATPPFQWLSGWCFHTVLPFVSAHLGMSGHSLGDAASFLPLAIVAAAAVVTILGTWRTVRATARWLGVNSIGGGPADSVIVRESELIVASAGIGRPQVIVSAGALMSLEDDELAAGLQHEWGHVNRGHRYITLASAWLLGCSRLLPGGRGAWRNLQFHLERDADQYAVRETGDPIALASAICKVAAARPFSSPVALASLAGADVAERLKILVSDVGRYTTQRQAGAVCTGLSIASISVTVALLLVLPGLAQGSAAQAHYSLTQIGTCFS